MLMMAGEQQQLVGRKFRYFKVRRYRPWLMICTKMYKMENVA